MEKINSPLAYKLRPKSITDVIGQKHLLDEMGIVTRMVQTKELFSLIFYGYPGIGKTSLAVSLSNDLNVPHQMFNAAVDKKEKLIEIINLAIISKGKYIVVVEEIHRLNKDKQDILLPYLENGTIIVFATTTENPYFTINPAIRSRCQILRLEPPSTQEIFDGLKKLLSTNNLLPKLTSDILKIIVEKTNGDLRSAINVLDLIDKLYKDIKIDINILNSIMSEAYVLASGYGDEYYDVLSAFHKSMRGSDIDASIHYLSRLLITNDLQSITRRIIACAYEDIGLANPQLCARVVTAMQACAIVGWPENKQILATVVIEMCMSPKSNSAYLAVMKSLNDIKNGKSYNIPLHLKDQSYASAKKLNHDGYLYPHDYPNHWVKQQYLPKELLKNKYYHHGDNIIEKKLYKYFDEIKNKKN